MSKRNAHIHHLASLSCDPPEDASKKRIKDENKVLQDRIRDLQRLLIAERKHSLLIVLQGMDAAGKDGSINAILGGMSAIACDVTAFKKPTEREMSQDFLWRVHQHAPRRGRVAIFNRSHYEDVLIQRVHNWIDDKKVKQRFDHVNAFERLLVEDNGTTILKFFLNISKDEQLVQLMERKTIRRKMWKHNQNDFEERKHWDAYMAAYEDVFRHCGPEQPWTVVPANKNWWKEHVILKTILQTLEGFGMEYPQLEE